MTGVSLSTLGRIGNALSISTMGRIGLSQVIQETVHEILNLITWFNRTESIRGVFSKQYQFGSQFNLKTTIDTSINRLCNILTSLTNDINLITEIKSILSIDTLVLDQFNVITDITNEIVKTAEPETQKGIISEAKKLLSFITSFKKKNDIDGDLF